MGRRYIPTRKPAVTLDSFTDNNRPAAPVTPVAKPSPVPPVANGKRYTAVLDPSSRSQQAALRYIAKARVQRGVDGVYYIVENRGKVIHKAWRGPLGFECVCESFKEHRRCGGTETAWLASTIDLRTPPAMAPSKVIATGSAPFCPKCAGMIITKSGPRITQRGAVQRYLCKTCGHRFSELTIASHLRVHPKLVAMAVGMHFEGMSYTAIARRVTEAMQINDQEKRSVTKSTIERWVSKMGKLLRDFEATLQPNPSTVWHTDETTAYVNAGATQAGRKVGECWTWNYMAHDSRYWLASLVTKGHSATEGRQAAKVAKKNAGGKPQMLVTDGYHIYNKVRRAEFSTLKGNTLHVVDPPIRSVAKGKDNSSPHLANNVMERLQQTQRAYTKPMGQFRSIESANDRLDALRIHYNLARPHEGLEGRTPAEAAGILLDVQPDQSPLEAALMAARLAESRAKLLGRASA